MTGLRYKVYSHEGRLLARTKDSRDALLIVKNLPEGSKIRDALHNSRIVWHQGRERITLTQDTYLMSKEMDDAIDLLWDKSREFNRQNHQKLISAGVISQKELSDSGIMAS